MAHVLKLIGTYERRRRFWRNVAVGGRLDCWPWDGETGADGRGRFRMAPADVRAYELVNGRLPPGARLEHLCGTAGCVNPGHMRVVEPTA